MGLLALQFDIGADETAGRLAMEDLFLRLGPDPEISADARGTYALVIGLERPARIGVGRLGTCNFAPGRYVYCGSALRGLRARISRHLRPDKRPHWHVDYLLPFARVLDVWVRESPERLECRLAAHLSSSPGAGVPVPGFGSSDCRCRSHLIYQSPVPDCLSSSHQGDPRALPPDAGQPRGLTSARQSAPNLSPRRQDA